VLKTTRAATTTPITTMIIIIRDLVPSLSLAAIKRQDSVE